MSSYKDLEQYGIIGNRDTCALVGDDGSIDWCCFPFIDSPSVFGAILDHARGGHFSITPVGKYRSKQEYLTDTNVLTTTFETDSGKAALTDFMPVMSVLTWSEYGHQAVYRKLTCTDGNVNFTADFSPRFNYAGDATNLEAVNSGIRASSAQTSLLLRSDVPLTITGNSAKAKFRLAKSNTKWFVLQYGVHSGKSNEECETSMQATIDYWRSWVRNTEAETSFIEGPWRESVIRSGLVLKLLAHEREGGICAAPTTSLPEVIGGERNWDYRYNWIRDASFSVQALYNLGHYDEARRHLKWFVDICRRNLDPDKIQIMYGIRGQTDLRETELNHLEGYKKSKPVRIGNGAAKQKQLDIYGELVNAIYETGRYGDEIPEGELEFVSRIADYVCEVWDTPDSGIWEVRGGPQHFVYSKLMCWVTLDRAIRIARRRGYNAPIERWATVRDVIRRAIIVKGYDRNLGSFVQSFGSKTLDATGLLIPIMGFLPADDKMVQGTINATLSHLTTESGLVYRYNGDDGLRGKEGAFLLCSFWLVKALALSNRIEEAEEILNKVIKFRGGAGLFSEEIDPATGKQLGNLPQAFSHIGMINSVLYLAHVKGKSYAGPSPTGSQEETMGRPK